mgnify:CR=1 FL=1
MDKKLILAKAGSGKTTELINKLNTNDKTLIITYTDSNYNILRNKIIEKFGEIPSSIRIYTYFSFLYKFCFAPLKNNLTINGLDFHKNNNKYAKSDKMNYYLNYKNMKMYHYRLAKICLDKLIDKIQKRIEKYFDYFYIDEIQDFSGHDFNFLIALLKCNIDILMVGDFYQHTYDTSRDGNVNINLYNDYEKYINIFKSNKIFIDTTSLVKSKRCSKTVCDFITNNLKIEIDSYKSNTTIVKELKTLDEINIIINDESVVKLFYKNHIKCNLLNTNNWGNSKGETYCDVCVVLNKTSYTSYIDNKLYELPPQTKNKLYVACSRPTRNLYFINEELLKEYKNS